MLQNKDSLWKKFVATSRGRRQQRRPELVTACATARLGIRAMAFTVLSLHNCYIIKYKLYSVAAVPTVPEALRRY